MEARAQARTTMTQKGGANGIRICCRKVLFGRCVVLGDYVGPNSPVMFPSSSGASFAEDLLSHLNQQRTHTHTHTERDRTQTKNESGNETHDTMIIMMIKQSKHDMIT